VRTQQSEIKPAGSVHSRALAVVAPGAHVRLVTANPNTAMRQSAWGSQHRSGQRLQCATVNAVNGRFSFPGRLAIAVGEVVEILIATSGTLVVVIILLAMAMMMRAVRTLLRR
jgi:hypothetical protein